MENKTIRLSGIANNSITDGPGIRYAIFTQGCKHACEGCHNPTTHDMNGGYEQDIQSLISEIAEDELLDGITLSGGDPFFQVEQSIYLITEVKKVRPDLNIWGYSGFTVEQIIKDPNKLELLKLMDVLIDGRFEQELRDLTLKFKGSSNQRLVDVKETLKQSKVIEVNL